MVLRTPIAVLGAVEALRPRPFVDFWMRLATGDADVEVRPWVYTAARVEGLLLLLWALRRGGD